MAGPIGSNIVDSLLARIEEVGNGFVEKSYEAIGTAMSTLLTAAFVLYVVSWGVLLLTGRSSLTFGEVIFRLIRMGAIYALVLSWPAFDTLVFSWASTVPDNVGTLLMKNMPSATFHGTTSTFQDGPGQALSDCYHVAIETVGAIVAKGGFTNVGPYILGLLVLVVALLLVGASLAMLVFAKMVFWVLLAIAPIAIGAALFPSTRRYFEGWLASTVTHFMIPVILYSVLGFFLSLTTGIVETLYSATQDNDPSMVAIGPFVLICLIGAFVVWQIPTIAQAIGGGIAVRAEGMGHWFGRRTADLRHVALNRAPVLAGKSTLAGGRLVAHRTGLLAPPDTGRRVADRAALADAVNAAR